MTVVQLLNEVKADITELQASANNAESREYAIAKTAIEDAQMRFTRGYAIRTNQFNPSDLEAINAGDH